MDENIAHSGAWGIALIMIVLVYWQLARREEKRVMEQFGDEYLAYQRRVPMFIPHMSRWRQLIRYSNQVVNEDE